MLLETFRMPDRYKGVRGPSRATLGAAAAVAGAAATLMGGFVSLPWEQEVTYGFHHDTEVLEHTLPIQNDIYSRTTVNFLSQGVRCEAWFYEPSQAARSRMDLGRLPPVVVMAHGLGSQKDMGLHPYAEQFAADGMATFVFDYRSFGGSDGLPRHEVNWRKHLEDWEAAVQHVVSGGLGEGRVDASHVALWGVSYSGGHVLCTAAALGDKIKAVVCNAPYLRAQALTTKLLKERGLGMLARAAAAAASDQVRARLGLEPAYIKLIGSAGELALLQLSDEEMAQVQHPTPRRQGGWQNRVAGRFLLHAPTYSPITHASKVSCPVLLVGGAKDDICPISLIQDAQARIGPNAQLLVRDHGHIELHKRGSEPEQMRPVMEFLQAHLGVAIGYEPAGPIAHTAQSQFG